MKGALVSAALAVAVLGVAHTSAATAPEGADGVGGVGESSSDRYPLMCGRGELFRHFGHQRGECGPMIVEGHHSPMELQQICDGLAEALRTQGEHPTDCDVRTHDGQTLTLTPSPPPLHV